MGPDVYISYTLPVGASAADLWATLEYLGGSILSLEVPTQTDYPGTTDAYIRLGGADGLLHDSLFITYILSRSTWCTSRAYTRFMSLYRHFWSLKLLISDRFLSRGDRTVIDSRL